MGKEVRLAIWGSGKGTNADAILKYFIHHDQIKVVWLASDNQNAKMLDLSSQYLSFYPELHATHLSKELRQDPHQLLNLLQQKRIDYLILAGYLKLINKELVQRYQGKILNIHPSLLPKYGGKGMYGIHVHQAVIQNQEKVSGLTIHLVNEVYDEGTVLFQYPVPVRTKEAADLQKDILQFEHYFYPRIIEQYIKAHFNKKQFLSMKPLPIKNALISVHDKTGLEPVLQTLHQQGVQFFASGGTASFIKKLGYACTDISELTQYPPILEGRVKTLHPKVFGAILAKKEDPIHIQDLQNHHINTLDLVIVDLYPFEKGLQEQLSPEQMIELIDIGGVSLIRAAAKNYNDVAIVPSVAYYNELLNELQQHHLITYDFRKRMAFHAFQLTAYYDSLIANYLAGQQTLRYGENPHQSAQFIGNLNNLFSKISGKELSYNNLLDIDAALRLIVDFEPCTCAVIKHTNPCGIATRKSVLDAWQTAFASDPTSAFGGIIVCNDTIDETTANDIHQIFFEVLIAPDYTPEALNILTQNAKRIILKYHDLSQLPAYTVRTAANGMLYQSVDNVAYVNEYQYVTELKPTDAEIKELQFAERCVKHLKSNAIAIVKNQQIIGSGMGQTSRIDALKHAIQKCKERGFETEHAVLASDAFFPFDDAVKLCKEAGIDTILQPGGSIRDKDSIQFCNNNHMKMVFTGIRHFKH